MHIYRYVLLMFFLLLLQACSAVNVQPWERDVLARKEMQIIPYGLLYYYDEHTYFSREASIGGSGAGGGGCGCN